MKVYPTLLLFVHPMLRKHCFLSLSTYEGLGD